MSAERALAPARPPSPETHGERRGRAENVNVLQLGGGASPGGAPPLADFGPAFWAAASFSIASLAIFLRLHPGDGAALRHRERGLRHHWQ
jgi:hypothetical protein